MKKPTFSQVFVVFISLMILAFGALLLLQEKPEDIIANGTKHEGVITEKWKDTSYTGNARSHSYYVSFELRNGPSKTTNRVSPVPTKAYDSFKVGEKVEVLEFKNAYYINAHGSLTYMPPWRFLLPGFIILLLGIYFHHVKRFLRSLTKQRSSND